MTAAISAASTRLSAACWRMMSSWRSGSLISSTAWWTGWTRLTTATITAARPAARRSRRRSLWRRRARVRWAAWAEEVRALAGWALMGSGGQLRKYPRQLLLEIPQRAGVFYSVRRPRGLLILRELARGALVDRLVAAGGRPLGAHGLVGHDGDRGVVAGLQPGLEQQRRLPHERPRRRPGDGLDRPPLGDPLA